MIVSSASEPALHLDHQPDIAVAIVIVTVVIVRVVRIGIRIEDWKTERVDEDERPIAEMAEMMCAPHGRWRRTRCWPRYRGARHHW